MQKAFPELQHADMPVLLNSLTRALALIPQLSPEHRHDLATATSVEVKASTTEFRLAYVSAGVRREIAVDFSPKLAFDIFETRTAEFGNKRFPLNLYGDTEVYKPHRRTNQTEREFMTSQEQSKFYGGGPFGEQPAQQGQQSPAGVAFAHREEVALRDYLVQVLQQSYGVGREITDLFFSRMRSSEFQRWLLDNLTYPEEIAPRAVGWEVVAAEYRDALGSQDGFESLWKAWARRETLSGQVDLAVGQVLLRYAFAIVRRELPAQMPDVNNNNPLYVRIRQIWELALRQQQPSVAELYGKGFLSPSLRQRNPTRQPRWARQPELSTGAAVTTNEEEPLQEAEFFEWLQKFFVDCGEYEASVAVSKLKFNYRNTTCQAAAARHFEWDADEPIGRRLEVIVSVMGAVAAMEITKQFNRFLRSDVFYKPLPTLTIEKKRAAFLVLEFVQAVAYGELAATQAPRQRSLRRPQAERNLSFWEDMLNGTMSKRLAPVRPPSSQESRHWMYAWLRQQVREIDPAVLPCVESLQQMLESLEQTERFYKNPLHKVPELNSLVQWLHKFDAKAWGFPRVFADYTLATTWSNAVAPQVVLLFLQALRKHLLPGQTVTAESLGELTSPQEVEQLQDLWAVLQPPAPVQIEPAVASRTASDDDRIETLLRGWLYEVAVREGVNPPAAQRFCDELYGELMTNEVFSYIQRSGLQRFFTPALVIEGIRRRYAQHVDSQGLWLMREFKTLYEAWRGGGAVDQPVDLIVLFFLDGVFSTRVLPGQNGPVLLDGEGPGQRDILTEQQALWQRVLTEAEQPTVESATSNETSGQ